jgi:hypothetical protein
MFICTFEITIIFLQYWFSIDFSVLYKTNSVSNFYNPKYNFSILVFIAKNAQSSHSKKILDKQEVFPSSFSLWSFKQ